MRLRNAAELCKRLLRGATENVSFPIDEAWRQALMWRYFVSVYGPSQRSLVRARLRAADVRICWEAEWLTPDPTVRT